VGDAFVEQPGIQLLIALHPEPRREEAFPHHPHLVLDLALLPARGRCAGDRLYQIVAAHLGKAPIELPILAQKHRIDRRLHVVVDAARAGALEECEGPVMGVKHHLLALAGIGSHKQHPTVAEPDMGHLHGDRQTLDQHDLMAPVELVGFAGCEGQRHKGFGCHGAALLAPALCITPHRIVAAVVSGATQFLEHPDQGQLFTR